MRYEIREWDGSVSYSGPLSGLFDEAARRLERDENGRAFIDVGDVTIYNVDALLYAYRSLVANAVRVEG